MIKALSEVQLVSRLLHYPWPYNFRAMSFFLGKSTEIAAPGLCHICHYAGMHIWTEVLQHEACLDMVPASIRHCAFVSSHQLVWPALTRFHFEELCLL